MRPTQSSITSAKASFPAMRSSTGSRRHAGSTRKNWYATYWPSTVRILRTVAELPVARLLRGGGDRVEARLRLRVHVVGAGLPAVEVGLVEQVEEVDRDHVRLACGELERLLVVLGLGLLGHRVIAERRVDVRLRAQLALRDDRLDAELGVRDRERRPFLGGAVEGFAEETDELVVVAEPEGRSGVRLARRDRGAPLVRVEREDVHDWLGPAAGAIGGAHVADELRRRVGWSR